MKQFSCVALCLLLLFGTLPARADFKYTETSRVTGGSIKGMMKFAGVFSKQASQAMKPMVSTRYVKSNMMRTDDADGMIQIIDVDHKLIIHIDPKNKSYSQVTFDELRDAMKKAAEDAKQRMQNDPKTKNTKVDVKAKVSATPGATGRVVNGYSANEMKIDIEMEMTAQQTPDGQTPAQSTGPVSGTMATHVDSWVAPDVAGYADVREFYKKMAKEIDWTPPPGITINPQVTQGMQELQKNQELYKGLPILQYVSMAMVGAQGATSTNSTDTRQSASNSTPTNPSEALVKGLGGLFGGKKKKKDDAATDPNSSSSSSTNPPPPPSQPGSLIEMTLEASDFSDAKLDPSLFTVPAGYTRMPNDPNNSLGARQPTKK